MDVLHEINDRNSHKNLGIFILENPEYFKVLMQIFLKEEYRGNQNASNVILAVLKKKPDLIKDYFSEMLHNLKKKKISDALKRNTLRIWQEVKIESQFEGEVYAICRSYLLQKEAVAIKAFSMEICRKIAQNYPDLKTELREIILENSLKYKLSPGIQSRAKNTLKRL